MAEFNPQTNSVGSNSYTGLSDRRQGDSSWSNLFATVVDTVDKTNIESINAKADTSAKALINEYFGVGDVVNSFDPKVDIGNGAEIGAGASTPRPVPDAIKQGSTRIANLGKAYENGTYSETNFWRQMDVTVKQMKSQYPGYEDEIDQAVNKAINQPTANQLRKAMYDDWMQKQGGVDAAQKAQDQSIKEWINKGLISENDLSSFKQGKVSYEELQLGVTRKTSKDYETTKLKNEYELSSLKRSDTVNGLSDAQNSAFRYADSAVREIFSNLYGKATGVTGESYKSFQDTLTKVQQDGRVDPNEILQLKQVAEPLVQSLRSQRNDLLMKPDKDGRRLIDDLKPADRESLDKQFDYQLKTIEEAMGGSLDAIGVMKLNALLNATDTSSRVLAALNTDAGKLAADAGTLNELSKNTFSPLIQAYLDKMSADGKNVVEQALTLGLVVNGAKDGQPIPDQVKALGNSASSSNKSTAVKQTLQANLEYLIDAKTSPEIKANLFTSTYSENLLSMVDFGSRQKLWLAMTTPEVTKAMVELEKTQPGSLNKYLQWRTSRGGDLFKMAKDSAQSFQDFSKVGKLIWDEESKLFSIRLDSTKFKDVKAAQEFLSGGPKYMTPKAGGVRGQSWEDNRELSRLNDGKEAVNQMNIFVRGIIPSLEAEGVTDPAKQKEIIMQALGGINLSGPKQNDWVDNFIYALQNPATGDDQLTIIQKEWEKSQNSSKPSVSTEELLKDFELTGNKYSNVVMENQSSNRNKDITPTLLEKLSLVTANILGEGVTARVISGGQDPDQPNRVGSNRHDHGNASDVRFYTKDGKQITDKETLDKVAEYWLANKFGSVGKFMDGWGMHLDEVTEDKLKPGQSLSWTY